MATAKLDQLIRIVIYATLNRIENDRSDDLKPMCRNPFINMLYSQHSTIQLIAQILINVKAIEALLIADNFNLLCFIQIASFLQYLSNQAKVIAATDQSIAVLEYLYLCKYTPRANGNINSRMFYCCQTIESHEEMVLQQLWIIAVISTKQPYGTSSSLCLQVTLRSQK